MTKKRYPQTKLTHAKKGDRVLAEEILAEAQRISSSGSWDWDLATGRIRLSVGMARLFGLPPKKTEMDHEAFIKFLHPDDVDQTLRKFQQGDLTLETEVRHRLIRPNDDNRIVHTRVKVYKDGHGAPARLFGLTWDYTGHQHMDQAYHESEQRYRTLVSSTPVVIFVTDKKGVFTLSEGRGLERLGLIPGQVVGQSAFDVYRDTPLIVDSLRKALGGTNQRIEVETRGTTFDIHFSCVLDPYGKVDKVICIFTDITTRVQAEKALQLSEEKYRFLIENMPDVVWQATPDLFYAYISPSDELQRGYKTEEILGRSIFEFMTPGSRSDVMARADARKDLLKRGEKIGDAVYEIEQIRKDGTLIWTEVSSHPVYDAEGRLIKFQGMTRDITERKRMEQDLRASEAKNFALVHAIPDLMFIQDRAGVYIEYHGHDDQLLAAPPEFFLGRITREVLPPEQVEDLQFKFDLAFQTGDIQTHEYLLDVPGGRRYFESRMITYADDRLLSLVRDITERKETEQRLFALEEFQRSLLDATNSTAIVLLDCQGIILVINNLGAQRMGMSQEALVGHSIFKAFPKNNAEELSAANKRQAGFEECCRTGAPVFFEDFGRGRWFENGIHPILDAEGKVVQVAVYSSDITHRKETERKLFALEEVQRILLNATTSTSIVLLDNQGTILAINEFGAKLIGRSRQDLVGLAVFDVIGNIHEARGVADTRQAHFEEVCRTARPAQFQDTRNGSWFENSMYPILDTAGKVVQVAVYSRDVTELKQHEEALRESEQRYRTLAEASHDLIFMIDREDRILYVNSYAANRLRAQPEVLIGQPRARWFEASNSEEMRARLVQVFDTGEPVYSEAEIVFLESSEFQSTWLVPLKGQTGAVEAVLGVSRDISNLKKMERSLHVTNLLLESTVKERTAELLESRDQLRKLTQQIVVAQEEERRRISRELHDEAGQALIGLRFSLDSIYKEMPGDLRKLRRRMAKALTMTDQTFQRIRSVAHDLRPPLLDLMGVNLGIKELCREFADQTGLKLEYSGIELEGLPEEEGISLYRFVQEALTNVAKHARASRVLITLEYKDEMIEVSVKDNGRGTSSRDDTQGFGMVGIKERIDNLGGTLVVSSIMPHGMELKVILPWKGVEK
jgi:PAS domain S-box-containing protein